VEKACASKKVRMLDVPVSGGEPKAVDGNFKPGFKIDLHIKDLANALDTGHGVGSPLPLTALAREMMETLHADGFGGDDHSALARYYAKLSGTAIGQ